jgi:hypothetical protein
MNELGDRMSEAVPATLEHEMGLIREAIMLVATGGAPRAVVAGLRLGDALLDPARRMGLEAGVRIVPIWNADDSGVDIAVEQIAE